MIYFAYNNFEMEVLLKMHKVNINVNLNPEDIARVQIRK